MRPPSKKQDGSEKRMKYFALTARKGTEPERSCALIDAPTIEDAALRAQRLKEEGFLSYVQHGSTYAIRPASRRETKLLQEFLNSCNRTEAKIHMQGDFDGLLARRQSLMMSFFMGLYLAPEKLRVKITGEGPKSSASSSSAPGGSGGIQQDPAGKTTTTPQAEASSPTTEKSTSQGSPEAPTPDNDEGSEAPIGNQAQEDMLASILGSEEANDGGAGRDVDIDLGDDELL